MSELTSLPQWQIPPIQSVFYFDPLVRIFRLDSFDNKRLGREQEGEKTLSDKFPIEMVILHFPAHQMPFVREQN